LAAELLGVHGSLPQPHEDGEQQQGQRPISLCPKGRSLSSPPQLPGLFTHPRHSWVGAGLSDGPCKLQSLPRPPYTFPKKPRAVRADSVGTGRMEQAERGQPSSEGLFSVKIVSMKIC